MAEVKYPVPEKKERTFLYTLGRIILVPVFKTILPIKYHNLEGLQLPAPYLLLANHQSMMDPIILAAGCKHYEIRFVGKKELTNNKLLAWLVKTLHMITVERHATDMQAMRTCLQVLREGHILGIFPEGTRHQADLMSEVETGTAVLAMRARMPVLPVYIHGKLGLFRRLHVYTGQPIEYADLLEEGMNTQTIGELSNRIQKTFRQMRQQHLDKKK